MTPLEFLAVVLPQSGYYCIAELTTPKKQHVFTETLEEAYEAVKKFDELKYDVYFGTSSFVTPENRKAENAKNTRSLFIDIDCGTNKSYATKKDAATALQNFVHRNGFPDPYVVSSGYGIHAYWPFKDETSAAKAAMLGSRFKRLVGVERGPVLQQPADERLVVGVPPEPKQLNIDLAVTGDTTRVLRVPGTTNWKQREQPKPVRILHEGVATTYEEIYALVDALLPPEEKIPNFFEHLAAQERPAQKSAVRALAVSNSTVAFQDIVDASKSGEGCKQIEHYLINAQKDGMEPLWRAVLSVTKYCSDGDRASRKVSALHPYDTQRMHIKLNEIKGPYPCHKFDSENPGVCSTCAHYGRISNPLAIARKNLTVNVESKITIPIKPVPVEETVQIEIVRPAPPRGFMYGLNGGVYATKGDSTPAVFERENLILPYDVFVVDLLSTENRHIVNFAVVRQGDFRTISVPQKNIVSRDETLKALSEQNIVSNNMQDAALHRYIRGSVEEASFKKTPIPVPANCGWQTDDTFVFDQRIFTDKGEKSFPMPGLENIFKSSKPTGALANWRNIINMLIGRGENDILAMSLVGFGAPLMRFTGLYGMTFHLGSTESGTGKTLAIELAASVWGDPVKSRTTIDTSSIATLNRLGLLGSLPLCTDEITAKNRADFEWLPTFLFSVTEGHGKERMESGANKERINNTYWQSLVLLSSNTHVMDYLTGARKHSSEGEIRRVLELTLSKQMELTAPDIELIKSLRQNYGTAGEQYSRWLVRNIDLAKQVVGKTYETLYQEFNATNDERFWVAGCTAIVAGGILAGNKYANIVDYPMAAIIQVLKRIVENARHMAKDSLRTAEDILNAFVRQFYGKFVVIRKVEGQFLVKFGGGGDIDESITRSDVMGRVEHLQNGFIELYVEETILRTFCASMSFGYSDFKRHISKTCGMKVTTKNMLAFTKGPPMVVKALQLTRPGDKDFESVVPVVGA